jgi:hypothetical protein
VDRKRIKVMIPGSKKNSYLAIKEEERETKRVKLIASERADQAHTS